MQWAAAGDDRLERFFLELKSDVDLNTQHGRHKVAKFILGAANRSPAQAARRLEGSAVLLLGVSGGAVTGIPGFEAKDLEREVRKLAGADGPGWDFEQIPVEGDRDVIAVIVDPPTGRVWPCMADGDGLKNGDVYIRGDGDTRKATGAELVAMMNRSAPVQGLPLLDVQVVGKALALLLDEDELRTEIRGLLDDYREQARTSITRGSFASVIMTDRRSREEFEREIVKWGEAALADPSAGVREIVARCGDGVRIRVRNPSRQPLREVRLDVYIDAATALDWEELREGETIELFPDRPLRWGRDISLPLSSNFLPTYRPAGERDRTVEIVRENPAQLSFTIDHLRPEEDVQSDDDDVVLFVQVPKERHTPLTVRWKLSAGDIPDLLEGQTTLPVEFKNLTGIVAVLYGEEI